MVDVGRSLWSRDRWALLAALVAPPAVAAALIPWRDVLANTDAALVLVLVVVAVAANGHRVSGWLSALSAGIWFDFFLTRPYETFTINRRSDLETTVLLLLVGAAVTELAVWGRRQHAEVSRRAGYDLGIRDAAESLADGASPAVVIDRTCAQLSRMFRLRRCRFDYGAGVLGGSQPRLRPDGQVEVSGVLCDVEHLGLPAGHDIELIVRSGAAYHGRFLLSATEESRPSLSQRLVAVALADHVGTVLAESQARQE
jgi:hypothetical protein